MKQEHSQVDKPKKGVQLFSDMMLMKFKPKNTQGVRHLKQSLSIRKQIIGQDKTVVAQNEINDKIVKNLNQIKYIQLASKDAVVIGNSNQLYMINFDGISHNFVDTFYYWSLNISKPILNVKITIKKQLMLILTSKAVLLYSYSTIKRQKSEPILVTSLQIENQVKFMQFPSSDTIALFYEDHFQIYSLNDSNKILKKLQKKYNVGKNFKLFTVPQGIDRSVNIFFEEIEEKKKTFGLWCIQVKLQTDKISISNAYKIYDIMHGLKKALILQNYSKDIVFLNLGQEILVGMKGYIVDSVNINLQVQNSYLRYLPRRNVLVHIEKNSMDLYTFRINTSVVPHRIQLTPLDSLEINNSNSDSRLISVLPVMEDNFALFYEQPTHRITTKGQLFYSFVVSHTVQIGQKINQILGNDKSLSLLGDQQLQAKCQVLRKIGLTDQEIYLQIWRKSSRSTVKDFQYILATRDYKTIKGEIEAKLKKQSMSFKEVLKIEESCLQILKPKIESQQCSQELLKDYLTCSLFYKKLHLYKQLYALQNASKEQKVLYINIQDYANLKNIGLKQLVLQRINSHLFSSKQNIHQIRLILYHFRFVYRYIYRDLLQSIIKTSKNQLKNLLKSIPQLLPVSPQSLNNHNDLSSGIWFKISEEEWQAGLYLQKIMNVFNRSAVEQFIGGLWYKRHWLTAHDFIAKPKSAIQKSHLVNNSIEIFYFFIDKIFDTIKDPQLIKSVLSHIEKNYQHLPKHLHNQILLYCTLYKYYKSSYQFAKCPYFTLAQFLQFKDYNLFKYFFDLQKMKKNTLLKDIKPIYEQILGQKGKQVFNLSLLNYFKSSISQISNLKYLLNRINNEKKEFHSENEKMYQILVKAVKFKLRIGSSNDIPINQVLIYIENLPISHNNHEMIRQLQIIQKISEQSEIFKKMRINMTIQQIMDNYEIVVDKLIQYQIKKYQILKLDNLSTILSKTYKILAEVQSIKQNIYGSDYNELAFFIYLTKLLEHQNKIEIANCIVNDQDLNQYYYIDFKILQSLVLYMYRWKFSKNSSFVANKQYINKLCELLPTDNPLRNYIQNQLEFAVLLSTPTNPVTFPMMAQSHYPRVVQLQQIIQFIEDQYLVEINIENVLGCMKRIQEFSHHLSEINKHSLLVRQSNFSEQKIEEMAIYRTFIYVFISRNLIKQAIPLIKAEIQAAEKPQVVSTLILIYSMLPELNEECRGTLIKISAYLYDQPLRLLAIAQNLITKPLTGLQNIGYLHKQLELVRQQKSNFNEDNVIFNIYFMHLSQEKQRQNRGILVQNTLIKLKKTKSQFQHQLMLDLVFIILCHQPFNLAIFLRNLRQVKWRIVRNFISYLVQEEIFDELNVIEATKRIFYLILRSYKEKVDIFRLVSQYSLKSLVEEFNLRKYQDLSEVEKILQKNVTSFLKKKQKLLGMKRSFRLKKNSFPDKSVSIKQSLKNPQTYKEKSANQYAFTDSDDNYEQKQEDRVSQRQKIQRKHYEKLQFDPQQERKNFIRKDQKANIEARKVVPNVRQKKFIEEEDSFSSQLHKSSGSARKYFSNDVRSLRVDQLQENERQIQRIMTDQPPFSQNNSPNKIEHKKSLPTFENAIKKMQSSKQAKKPNQNAKRQDSDSQEKPLSLFSYTQQDASNNQELQENATALIKKIYRTFDEKQESEPYNIKVMHTQKAKNPNYMPLFTQSLKKIYRKPERTIEIAFKLIGQLAKSFPQLQINLENASIYQKIAKFQAKYGLELPLEKILPFEGLFIKNKTPQQLFDFTKDNIIEVCDHQNIFKISKLISIGFKKNAIEQEIIVLFLGKLIEQMNKMQEQADIEQELQKIKGLINKMQIKMLMQKTEGLVDKCTNFDQRRKLVDMFIGVVKLKANSKDAKQLQSKLK